MRAKTQGAAAVEPQLGTVTEEAEGAEEGSVAAPVPAVDPVVATDAAASAAPLVCLADQLASVCGGSQVLLARACWQWVSAHTVPPPRGQTWSIHEPLFGRGGGGGVADGGASPSEVAEVALLSSVAASSHVDGDGGGGGGGGAWAERSAWLFVQLARACELEAAAVPGYWRDGSRAPGARWDSHNHSWAAVKVNGRWRLVDTTAAALLGGGGGGSGAPFFVPPEALIHTYFPLEAHWQLLPTAPISLEAWWELPELSVSFFTRGCRLVGDSLGSSGGLRSVNTLPSYKEGERMPTLQLDVAVPVVQGNQQGEHAGVHLTHTLYDAAMDAVVASWSARQKGGPGEKLAFQQVRGKRPQQCRPVFICARRKLFPAGEG